MSKMRELMQVSPVIPVVAIEDAANAVPLAQALLDGGIAVIEVTLRTAAALDAIAAIAEQCPDMCVGAGTVWTEAQAHAVIDAGAQFVVSPGISMPVYHVCGERDCPILPGCQTTSEVAQWAALGLDAVKFFPAQYAGGVGALKSFMAVFPDMWFCPTGGISLANAADYLALKAVPCVGGSWIVDNALVAAGDWSAISDSARKAGVLAE
ncbi:MAG: bifunctional 4-hydroxy-2-oxoglutarate aldolase/2-dehydro-3-deoxy-phosphogluconate aldolase [Pseudomonadota bacterium]